MAPAKQRAGKHSMGFSGKLSNRHDRTKVRDRAEALDETERQLPSDRAV